MNSKRSLILLMIVPVLLLVQLGIGLGIYISIKRAAVTEANNNKLDLYLRTNTKYISHGESAERAYLLTGAPKYYDLYTFDLYELKKNEAYYDSLPKEIKRSEVRVIQAISRQRLDLMAQTIQYYNNGAKDSAMNLVKDQYGQVMTDSIRAKSTLLRAKISGEFTRQRIREYDLLYLFFAIVAVLIVISLLLSWLSYRAFNQYTNSLEKTIKALEETHYTMIQYHAKAYNALEAPLDNISGFKDAIEKKDSRQLDGEVKNSIHFLDDGIQQLRAVIADMRSKYFKQIGDGPKPAP